jgi:hypothetical protein
MFLISVKLGLLLYGGKKHVDGVPELEAEDNIFTKEGVSNRKLEKNCTPRSFIICSLVNHHYGDQVKEDEVDGANPAQHPQYGNISFTPLKKSTNMFYNRT